MDSKLLEELTDDNIDEQLITEEIEKLSEEYDLRAIKSVYLCTVLAGCSLNWNLLKLKALQSCLTKRYLMSSISINCIKNCEKAALHQHVEA